MKSLKQIFEDFQSMPTDIPREFTEERKDKIKGGKGDKASPDDFDQKELMKGIHHEMEHTDKISIAMEIAIDHLSSNENYYSELERSGIDKD